ncbi:Zinc finger, CCHC-type [Sesbania bispinosa]|nr:Zinc finger, CCHC-type [Sesbania bispinosa]
MKEINKATENQESVEASAVQIGDNIVLRKLLRGPRYFDPPNTSWGACYNCGEEGHAAVNCTAAKRKKPCYVCGGLGHSARQCTKAQDCFICKKGGHRAKDCPEKHMNAPKNLTICLKCGNSGHDMFSCKNDYSLDDLKEIQCYVCKAFGHLCCVNTDDATPGEVSCYKCGQLGHTGLACSRLRGESETTGAATPSSCYRCGEEGHFARECTNSIKVAKKKRELSNTKYERSHKENDYMGHRSAPHDVGKTRKKKRPPTEERGFTTPKKSKNRGGWMREHHTEERGFATPKKSKSRGGWMMEHPTEERDFKTPKKSKSRGGWTTEHPGEFPPSKSKWSSWRSPGSPSTRSTKIHSFGYENHTSSSKSSKSWKGQPGASSSQGSAMVLHHRFSAPRFGNSSSDGHRRSYNWW